MTTRLMTEKELAVMLNVKEYTIRRWRMDRKGPPYLKLGRTVRYDRLQVEERIEKVDPSKQKQEVTKVSKQVGDYQEFSMPRMNMKRTRFHLDDID